jgi:hypothetical protein
MTLYDCPKLQARLTAEGCRRNKSAGTIQACHGCDGINPAVVVVDFTGHEDVLRKLRLNSDDLQHDIICVMDAITDGKLAWR